MSINQLSTANTFQQWLIATQGLITVANTLTDGGGDTFIANTILEVSGTGSTLIVKNEATINVVTANTVNTGNLTVTSNILAANVTDYVKVGTDLTVYGNANITGNLIVSGNITLDEIGFDDLSVAGSGTFGNTLSVTGITTLSNLIVTSNISTINVTNTLDVGADANVFGNVYIAGDLTIGGNVTLDSVGFDDLNVAGSGNFANTLSVTGNTTLSNATISDTLTLNVLTGNANTTIFTAITEAEARCLAYSIALG